MSVTLTGASTFSFTTEWMDDNASNFEELRKKTMKLRNDYLAFVRQINDSYKSVKVEYHDIDEDDHGDETTYRPVIKWLVEFTPSTEISSKEIVERNGEKKEIV